MVAAAHDHVGVAKGLRLDTPQAAVVRTNGSPRPPQAHEAGSEFVVKAGKQISLTSGKDMGVKVEKKLVVDAGDEFTVKCGAASFSMKKNGDIVIKGKKITVKGSDKVTIKGAKVHEN